MLDFVIVTLELLQYMNYYRDHLCCLIIIIIIIIERAYFWTLLILQYKCFVSFLQCKIVSFSYILLDKLNGLKQWKLCHVHKE